jgi:hypothetical protein
MDGSSESFTKVNRRSRNFYGECGFNDYKHANFAPLAVTKELMKTRQ